MWFAKKYWTFESSKKKFLCVCMYKMVNIDKETHENNNIEAIVDGIGKLMVKWKAYRTKVRS